MASAAEELSSVLQEINRSAAQISAALEQVRKGAQNQASASEELSAAVSQIEKVLEIARNRAKVSLEKIIAIQKLLGDNKTNVNAMVEGIIQSAEEAKANLNRIKELELLSRKIDKIVDSITMVSVQTNMLAVSGAIEAARAGEFGKGFAVVASDIRNLAHDSAVNAEKIKDMVKAIQDQVNIVMRDIEEIMKSAVEETEKAKIATEGLNTIEKDMQEVKAGSEEILSGAE